MEYSNNDYINYGKEVIKLINKNGAEAYFVGQFARNLLMDKPFKFIELFTTATNQQLEEIFCNYKIEVIDDENVYLNYRGYTFEICTFKSYVQKENVKARKRHYNSTLMDYLERRDFVLNAVAINYSNKIIDVFEAKKDIKKKKIKMIGDPKVRFNESPIRILRALALVSEYGFKLDSKIYKGFKKRKKLLKKLSPALLALEFKPILEGPYAKKAIRIMYDTGIYKKLEVFKKEISRLDARFKKETMDEFLINAFVLNGEINQNALKVSDNEEYIKKVVNVALANPKSNFDAFTLYRNGLDVCLASNKANVITHRAKKKYKTIEEEYNNLPIKKTCDLKFKGQDILEITGDNGGEYLVNLIEDIEAQVLMGVLVNDYETIKVYVYKKLYELKNEKPIQAKVLVDEVEEKNQNEEMHSFDYIENSNVKEEIKPNDEVNPLENEDNFYEDEILKSINNLDEKKQKEKDFEKQIQKIELDELEDMLNKEIEELINKSQVLEGLVGIEAVETYKRMKERYRDALIEKYDKYKRLKDRYHE